MKVILLTDVAKVGKKFDVKEVSSGYALNLLIPKGLARAATADAVKKVEKEKAEESARKKKTEETLINALESIKGMTLEMKKKANEKGHLFAAIHKDEVVSLLKDRAGVELHPENIVYDKQFKEAGEHAIEVKVGEKSIKIKLDIKAEK